VDVCRADIIHTYSADKLQQSFRLFVCYSLALKKLSYRWQTVRRSKHSCQELPSGTGLRSIGQIFRLLLTHLLFDAFVPLELSGLCLVLENWNGWATIWWRSHDDRLSRLGTIHQRDRHTDSHVVIANAALTHCVGLQKPTGHIIKFLKPRIFKIFQNKYRGNV